MSVVCIFPPNKGITPDRLGSQEHPTTIKRNDSTFCLLNKKEIVSQQHNDSLVQVNKFMPVTTSQRKSLKSSNQAKCKHSYDKFKRQNFDDSIVGQNFQQFMKIKEFHSSTLILRNIIKICEDPIS